MRTAITIGIVAYWVALFAATHVPRIPAALQMPGSDKWQHFAAYGGLAFLLSVRQFHGQSLSWKTAAQIIGILAVYGAFDELSQIPVGRDAEWYDWFADLIGAIGGIAVFAAGRAVFRRRPAQ